MAGWSLPLREHHATPDPLLGAVAWWRRLRVLWRRACGKGVGWKALSLKSSVYACSACAFLPSVCLLVEHWESKFLLVFLTAPSRLWTSGIAGIVGSSAFAAAARCSCSSQFSLLLLVTISVALATLSASFAACYQESLHVSRTRTRASRPALDLAWARCNGSFVEDRHAPRGCTPEPCAGPALMPQGALHCEAIDARTHRFAERFETLCVPWEV